MTRYAATIRHHSIARARVVDCGDDLTAAKRKASTEFKGENCDYMIVVIDRNADVAETGSNVVASRLVGGRRWK